MTDQLRFQEVAATAAQAHLTAPRDRLGFDRCLSVAMTGSSLVDAALDGVDGISADLATSLAHASSDTATRLGVIAAGLDQLDADLGGAH